MGQLTGCTIVSANYLPFARVLAYSFLENHPEGRFVVLLVDHVDGRFDPSKEPFELLTVEQLPTLPETRSFLFKYTILEANTAVKPYLLEHLLHSGADQVIYLATGELPEDKRPKDNMSVYDVPEGEIDEADE